MFVVAGVSGHVGSVVAKELLAAGEKVRVLVRDEKKGEPWMKAGAEVAIASFEDTGKLAAALEGAEGFFTLLPPNYPPSGILPWLQKLADSIAAAVKASKVPHVVLLSSVGAELPEGTGPIRGVHYAEKVLRATGTKLTAVRAGYFQENVLGSVKAAKSAGIFPNTSPSADAPFPMVATRDIGALAAHELRFPSAGSEVVDLAGPSYTVRQAAELLGKRLGKTLQVVDIPPEKQVDAFKQAGMSQEMAELFAEMVAGFATGNIRPHGDRLKLGRTPLAATLAGVS